MDNEDENEKTIQKIRRLMKRTKFQYGFILRENLTKKTDDTYLRTIYTSKVNLKSYLYHKTDYSVDRESIEKVCNAKLKTQMDVIKNTFVFYTTKENKEKRNTIPLCDFSFDDGILPLNSSENSPRKRVRLWPI